MIIYSLVITFLLGISVGYTLCKITNKSKKKKIEVKTIKYKKIPEEVINTSTNKPFVIEDLKDDVIPKLHEEVEVAK